MNIFTCIINQYLVMNFFCKLPWYYLECLIFVSNIFHRFFHWLLNYRLQKTWQHSIHSERERFLKIILFETWFFLFFLHKNMSHEANWLSGHLSTQIRQGIVYMYFIVFFYSIKDILWWSPPPYLKLLQKGLWNQ